ncbi:MAG: septum formation initiator family protein [Peptococcaceae bacterium]|jgi:cell division protein FtsB|nr:septum formation initiator family protein [Peptococcaceae bacterium]MDH7523710.1 septum formation initiator family protein [Peptococcaceae bacterium]
MAAVKKNGSGKAGRQASSRPDLYVINGSNLPPAVSRTKRKRRISRFLSLCLFAFGLYLVIMFAVGGYQVWHLKAKLKSLEEEQRLLLQEQKELEEGIKSLNDPEIIERMARENLGMVKQGETVIIPALTEVNTPQKDK